MKEGEGRTTIYKKNVDKKFSLRMKASRSLLNEITKKSPTMPFSLRQFDEKSAKMGITELTVNNLVSAYPVLVENKGVEVARFQTTVLILPSGPAKVTGMPMPAYFNSEKTLNEVSFSERAQRSERSCVQFLVGHPENTNFRRARGKAERSGKPSAADPPTQFLLVERSPTHL